MLTSFSLLQFWGQTVSPSMRRLDVMRLRLPGEHSCRVLRWESFDGVSFALVGFLLICFLLRGPYGVWIASMGLAPVTPSLGL